MCANMHQHRRRVIQPQSIRILESGVPQPAMHWPQKVCHVLCPEPSAKFIAPNESRPMEMVGKDGGDGKGG